MENLHTHPTVERQGPSLFQEMQKPLHMVEKAMALCDSNEHLHMALVFSGKKEWVQLVTYLIQGQQIRGQQGFVFQRRDGILYGLQHLSQCCAIEGSRTIDEWMILVVYGDLGGRQCIHCGHQDLAVSGHGG